MILVDTHCHVSPYWYEPVETLLHHMDLNQVAHAVLVQYRGQYNNAYQAECVRRFPERFASVVLVNTGLPNSVEDLERLAEQGARGVRFRPGTRSPGDDPLAIWRKAQELGLPVSCGGLSTEFATLEFADVVESMPGLPIILEHLGSINVPDGEPAPYEVRQRVFSLARFANVYVKVQGLGEFCTRSMPVTDPFPFETPISPVLEMAYEAFGPHRMMWGSDFPPVSSREGYRNALRFSMGQFEPKGEEAKELIFGRVALDLYGFQ